MTKLRAIAISWPSGVRRWLAEPYDAFALWAGKHCVLVAWLGLLAAVASPPHGFGLPVCWFHDATGLPCPGCGLTRSLSCGIRGRFLESWNYHPLGLFILALFVVTAGQSLLPKTLRRRLARWVQSRAAWFKAAYAAFVIVFVAYGAARALLQLALKLTPP